MINKRLITIFVASIISTVGFFSLTDPQKIPVGLLMIPIISVFIICSTGSLLVMRLGGFASRNLYRQRFIAVLFGVVGALYIVFQSTGGLVVGDVILIILIFALAYLYITNY